VLATFVIGLREGLEAALIVGIVAAYLRRQGKLDALRYVWLGVAATVAFCVAVAVALQLWSASLPEAQQEALATVLALVAVAAVTYMIVWMRRHARELKHDLEGATATALAKGTAWALVATAVLAVLREGLETAVFLLASFNASDTPLLAGGGALAGILVAAGVGYGIYRGGVRLNLARFFKLTGLVLVLIAGGLVASAAHSAYEAGWLTVGQATVTDLSWLVQPGSVQAALLTGILGLRPQPTVAEVLGWLLYIVPVGLYVAWPQGRQSLAGPPPTPAAAVSR
jgi:high-affinity iron transporter